MKIAYAEKVSLRTLPVDAKNKISDADMNEIKDSVNWLYDATGWASYGDTSKSSGSPQVIAEGDTAALVNNGATVENSQIPDGITTFYSGGKIRPESLGDIYLLEVHVTAAASKQDGAFDIVLSNGHATRQTISLRRASATHVHVARCFTLIGDDDGVANGVGVSIEAINGDISIYGAEYIITRVHAAR